MEVMIGFGCWVPQQDLYLRLEPHGHALFLAAPCSIIKHQDISLYTLSKELSKFEA
jgi:hypothetical protein